MLKKTILAAAIVFSTVCTLSAAKVKPGIEVLRDNGFAPLVGKRVGLVTNPSGVDSHLNSTIDILFSAPGVDLVALFAPEHGVRGDAYAGAKVEDASDPGTGVPVYSIYGKNTVVLPGHGPLTTVVDEKLWF